MTFRAKTIRCAIVVLALFAPRLMFADYGYFTMPVDPATLSYGGTNHNAGINSWVDHTSPLGQSDTSTVMTRYDGMVFTASTSLASCTNGVQCYSGHEGIDYAVASGTAVFAVASGTVRQSEWQSPSDHSFGFGIFVSIWHGQYGASTLYAHLSATTTNALAGNNVSRAQLVGYSGATGDANGANHLHFQVYNADVTITSSTNGGSQFSDSVDPYGWFGTSTDPWKTNDAPFGYMWADPLPHATSSFVHYETSSFTMTASSTWNADQIYIIQDGLTVSSTATLTIKQGAVVKFGGSDPTSTSLTVDGKLDVQGTSTDPVYFTSIEDDSVGGDMNDDATATIPGQGNWQYIKLDNHSTSTIRNAVIRYGGNLNSGVNADVYADGGYLSATSTTFASSSAYGIQMASGTVKITSSTFVGNRQEGFWADGTGNLTVTSSTFSDSGKSGVGVGFGGTGFIAYDNGLNFTSTGNTSTRNAWNAYEVGNNNINSNVTWQDTVPYVPGTLTISSGKTLTINPGVVVKFDYSTIFNINGQLSAAATTSTKQIYFTSLKDDSIGGDTNDDGASTTPATGSWSILTAAGSSSTFNYSTLAYGGYIWLADLYMNGGTVHSKHTTIASSDWDGIKLASGTLTIVSSTFLPEPNFAVENTLTSTSSASAQQNWWGSASGPYNPNSNALGNTSTAVSDYVSYTPYLTSAPQ